MGRYHGLSRDEEIDLFRRMRAGDETARQQIILRHRGLVAAMASKHARFGQGRLPQDDLEQEGVLGLYRAIDRFDPEYGTRFNTYARWWIRHRMQRAGERARYAVVLPGSRPVRKYRHKGPRTKAVLRHRLGREPTREEVAAELDIPVWAIEQEDRASLWSAVAIDGRGDEDEGAAEVHVVLRASTDVVRDVEQRRVLERVQAIFCRLPKREQAILRSRYFEDRTLDSIGQELGVSRERIRQLEARALEALRDGLRRAGVLAA